MLGLVVLIALQFAIALLGAPVVMRMIPVQGDLTILVQAAVYAVIVWGVAFVGAFALKEVNVPSGGTLVATLVGALIGAGLTLVPQVVSALPQGVPRAYLPLIGAIVGYMVRRT